MGLKIFVGETKLFLWGGFRWVCYIGVFLTLLLNLHILRKLGSLILDILIFISSGRLNTWLRSTLIHIPKYHLYRVGCLFRVSKNVSEFYFLGACISKMMDLERGINCTSLLNVFKKLSTLSTLENLALPDLSLLLPTTLSKGGGSEDPRTNS